MNKDKLTIEEIKQCYQYHSIGRKPGKTLLLRTCNELIGYKNIEKDLGLDLSVLIKAIKQEYIWVINEFDNKPEKQTIYMYDLKNGLFICNDESCPYYFNEYGKTWALTRKELIQCLKN